MSIWKQNQTSQNKQKNPPQQNNQIHEKMGGVWFTSQHSTESTEQSHATY